MVLSAAWGRGTFYMARQPGVLGCTAFYLRHAKRARALAATLDDPYERDTVLKIAEDWARQAVELKGVWPVAPIVPAQAIISTSDALLDRNAKPRPV
jgi:hypothetical protein